MDDSTKKAVAYSLLAHIRNSGALTNGPIDLFIPIVKKGLHFMNNNKEQYKGRHISEIKDIVEDHYGIDIPLPVLESILKQIAKEINSGDEKVFELNNDRSFWIKDYIFEDYDQKIQESQKIVENLQRLFFEFCKANGIDTIQNNCIIKFIEKNKLSISKYLANIYVENGKDFIIEARFLEYFKSKPIIFSQIKNIYLGSILTCYLEYQPSVIKMDVTLLFDTNFIVSLLDLNTPESTHTCKKLVEICSKLGYRFNILTDTIEEIIGLLNYKSCNFDSAVILKFVNKEDIYNACERRKLTRTDLDRIADNLEETINNLGIGIIPPNETLRNKAKFSKEYNGLKGFRHTEKAALHDAIALIFVKEKRGSKRIKDFERVNCWFVNNSISHDIDSEGTNSLLSQNNSNYQPEVIKADDLLNVLWLSNPSINTTLANDELIDIGLTSLIAFTLNEALPKARIIKELDENIQKYRNESISDKDVLLLATRIANGQIKSIERLNEFAKKDIKKFNEGIKEEAKKQDYIEKKRSERFEQAFKMFEEKYSKLNDYKEEIDIQAKAEINQFKEASKSLFEEKELQIKKLEVENLKKENKIRESKRNEFLNKNLKSWRWKSWRLLIIVGFILLFGIFWLIVKYNGDLSVANDFFETNLNSKLIVIILSILSFVIDLFIIKALYDKHLNHSNISAYKLSIEIPDEIKPLDIPK